MKRRLFLGLLLGLLAVGIWQRDLLSYGYMQARGQLRIMRNTRPIDEMLADPTYPDSLKARIRFIQAIKQFAQDSLHLNPSKNFTTFYDQQGKPLLWVLVGSDRYALKAVEHDIPILGTFPYQGFFDKEKLLQADSLLQREGYDTRINEVAAYSTLGFFRDPILSSMLSRTDGSLAELIIHELTHGTLFVKDNLEYNENLADFVGEYGAERFMAAHFGRGSVPYRTYLASNSYYDRYNDHLLRGTQQLDRVYRSFKPSTAITIKEANKWQTIGSIVSTADTLTDDRPGRTVKRKSLTKANLPNNAYFVGFLTYRKQQNRFRTEFVTQFNSDFPRYLTHLKQTYPSL